MFIFPIRTDRQLKHTPWVNYAFIAVNVFVFILTQHRVVVLGDPISRYFLHPLNPQLWQFITYQFLHINIWHLLGNMVFLFVFGNGLEDRLGKFGYLFFYLAGGVVAGIGHMLSTHAPVLGASGSVAAVTGAFLALFPLCNVTIIYWFFFIGAFEISSMLLIGFQISQNIVFHVLDIGGPVAYLAHLSGYAFGFTMGMSMLWTRLLPREPYDLLSLLEQRRRRAQFRRLARSGYQPWESAGGAGGAPGASGGAPAREPSPQEKQLMALRGDIAAAIQDHNLDRAADLYRKLLQQDASQVMGQQQQLDLANHLMAKGRYDAAAVAYELFLNTYSSYSQREQVQLILGLIYARYLERRQRARELLTAALPRLHDVDQKALAREVLSEIG